MFSNCKGIDDPRIVRIREESQLNLKTRLLALERRRVESPSEGKSTHVEKRPKSTSRPLWFWCPEKGIFFVLCGLRLIYLFEREAV